MPTYPYRCANKHETVKFFRVKDYEEAVDCDKCDLAAVRIFTAPVMVKAAQDVRYTSPVDDRPITTHAARREDMKRHDCIEYDPEMRKDAARKHRERSEAFERGVEETVAQEIAKMPAKKKAKLVQEVVHQGLTTEAVRI